MKRIIELPKIDYNGTGRKINRVTIEISLEKKVCTNWDTLKEEEMYVFSASGNVWNSKNTDIIAGGQILDELDVDKQLLEVWKEYHLNDLQAGTKNQHDVVGNCRYEEALEKLCFGYSFYSRNVDKFKEEIKLLEYWKETNNVSLDDSYYIKTLGEYEQSLAYYTRKLEDSNLYDRGYRYGSGWLCKPIPSDVVTHITHLINESHD